MRDCVIKFGENIVVSIVVKNQLVLTSVIKDVSELCDILYKSNIDSMSAIFQGTPASVVPNDSVKLSNYKVGDVPMSCVCTDDDIQTVLDLCNTYKIENVKIHSYLDFILDKYSKEREVIVVDSWVSSYAIIYIKDGVIKDFRKTTHTRFESTLSSCKSDYNCIVINNKNQYDSVSLRSCIENYQEIDKSYMHCIEHIPFCLQHDGINLRNNNKTDMSDWIMESAREVKSVFEDDKEDNSTVQEDTPKSTPSFGASLKPSRNKKKAIGGIIDSDRIESEDKAFNVLISIALVILTCCAIAGILVSVVYKGKINLLQDDIQILAKDSVVSQQIDASLSGNVEKAPATILNNISDVVEFTELDSLTYENGSYSVMVSRETEDDLNLVKTNLSSAFVIANENYIGKFKTEDKEYNKTKFIINFKT